MAYREDVDYIESMQPEATAAVIEDFHVSINALKDSSPSMTSLVGKVDWHSDSTELFEQRLREAIDLADGLHDGFDHAAKATREYQQAQIKAQEHVKAGKSDEDRLKTIIPPVIKVVRPELVDVNPLQQWEVLRVIPPPVEGEAGKLGELALAVEVENVFTEAEGLFSRASGAYDEAIRVEQSAREAALPSLQKARQFIPDFLASSELSQNIVSEFIEHDQSEAPGEPEDSSDSSGGGGGRGPAATPTDTASDAASADTTPGSGTDASALQADPATGDEVVGEIPTMEDSTGHYQLGEAPPPELEFDNDFPYDPDAHPTPSDYAELAKWKATLTGAEILRPDLDDATGTYAHYLDGTGTPFQVDYEEAYQEDPNIQTAVDAEILAAQQAAEELYLSSGRTSFAMSGDPSSVTELGDYPSTENWQKALGDHQIYSTSNIVVDGNKATMTITVKAEDMYNFNAGASDIVTGTPDEENGRFSTLGWAQAFPTSGELQRTVTWTIGGDPTVSTLAEPAQDSRG